MGLSPFELREFLINNIQDDKQYSGIRFKWILDGSLFTFGWCTYDDDPRHFTYKHNDVSKIHFFSFDMQTLDYYSTTNVEMIIDNPFIFNDNKEEKKQCSVELKTFGTRNPYSKREVKSVVKKEEVQCDITISANAAMRYMGMIEPKMIDDAIYLT